MSAGLSGRSLVLVSVLAAAVLAVLLGLGTWQLERLAWKNGLIATVDARFAEPPGEAPQPPWEGLDLAEVEYRRVRLEGRFLPQQAYVYTVLSDARGPLSGPGYWVVSPFETRAGWTVLVNRGFVPVDGRGPAAHAPPEGERTIEGVVRGADPPGMFTPAANLADKVWFVRDARELAPAFALPEGRPLAPFTVDAAQAEEAERAPQAGETRRVFPNNHLQYALTWYGLAAALIAVYAAFVLKRRRR